MNKGIFLFIVLMRALAAIMITNAHYTGVYPTDLIANGGLLGDVLFFAVSGFCLANTSSKFSKWYLKRFVRVYIPSWLMTLIYMALGAYMVTGLQDIINPLAELNKRIFKSANRFVVNVVYILKDCKCTYFP